MIKPTISLIFGILSIIISHAQELPVDSTNVIWLEKEISIKKELIQQLDHEHDSLYQLGKESSDFLIKKEYLKLCNQINASIIPTQKGLIRLQQLLLIEEKKQTKLLETLSN